MSDIEYLLNEIDYLSSMIRDESPYSDLQERCNIICGIARDIAIKNVIDDKTKKK